MFNKKGLLFCLLIIASASADLIGSINLLNGNVGIPKVLTLLKRSAPSELYQGVMQSKGVAVTARYGSMVYIHGHIAANIAIDNETPRGVVPEIRHLLWGVSPLSALSDNCASSTALIHLKSAKDLKVSLTLGAEKALVFPAGFNPLYTEDVISGEKQCGFRLIQSNEGVFDIAVSTPVVQKPAEKQVAAILRCNTDDCSAFDEIPCSFDATSKRIIAKLDATPNGSYLFATKTQQ
ncbi:hypothetical protein PROFUN_12180 [Planoprotostelium fungivorum]|uniref:Uncharacterized protein n=1 Tax=Planoprotostelium fungivorum TaxID=1890364 RepID=A0A2P6N8H6_9EUKA|nr:hypothetical protein PROFUN_12180 [Planoprotostelium fungivorum]